MLYIASPETKIRDPTRRTTLRDTSLEMDHCFMFMASLSAEDE
jgi:hypothetical protein